jgi:hypothetical protein
LLLILRDLQFSPAWSVNVFLSMKLLGGVKPLVNTLMHPVLHLWTEDWLYGVFIFSGRLVFLFGQRKVAGTSSIWGDVPVSLKSLFVIPRYLFLAWEWWSNVGMGWPRYGARSLLLPSRV